MLYILSYWQHYEINKPPINRLKYSKYEISFIVENNNSDANYRSTIRQD
jgi:hypothetical protein